MSSGRPDPDALLKQVQAEEALAKRGKLAIFFGAAPGVGKTYTMLETARTEQALKRDLVVGIVESHGRYETAALTLGLELLPRRKLEYRGVTLEEFDIDRALARKPGLIVVDELAHTNAEGSRHKKRWQDVEELLDAGIDVYTTLNVQHLESLNDIVAQITGVVVRETVPDSILDRATEVKLIDVPPDELIERLQEGKVYLGDQAGRAVEGFFRKGNLIALRELALRETAQRVDAQMEVYRRAHGIDQTWAAGERMLVCVSPSPASARLVRATRRMAANAHADWIAVYVETPGAVRLSSADRDRVAQHLRLAEQLGAEVTTLPGASAAEVTLGYARQRNVTRIIAGKPTHPRWRDLFRPSFLEDLVRGSGAIDIHVISGEKTAREGSPPAPERSRVERAFSLAQLLPALAAVVASTTLGWLLFGRDKLADVVMIYLLGIVLVSMRYGYAPSLLAAILGVIAFDFFFVPPFYSFAVTDLSHIITFGVMLLVAFVISNLTKRLRDQVAAASDRERRTASLYAISRDFSSKRTTENLLEIAVTHLNDVFDSAVAILLPDATGKLVPGVSREGTFALDEKDAGVADWVWRHHKPAGLTTDTLPAASALFLPLRSGHGGIGVLGIRPADAQRVTDPDQKQLLLTFASQISSAIERAQLAEETQRAALQIETEQLRNALLSSVSHDLRTPLAVITGATSAVLEQPTLDPETQRELLQTVFDEAERLNRLVRNLLDMTRVEAGALKLKREWQPIEEVIGAALTRTESQLGDRPVQVELADDLPLVPIDAILIEQVLINLLENATKYTPVKSPIDISARSTAGAIVVEVADRGPGVVPGDEEHVFEKFFRAREGQGGVGLGLTICRGIVLAHGGKVTVENRPAGGAIFRFTLPIEGEPPAMAMEDPEPR